MIIQRKYEWFGLLYESDEKVKKLVDEALEMKFVAEDLKKLIFEHNYSGITAFFELGCGIPGESYSCIMEGLEQLDKKEPYDNGMTFNDVNKIEFETSRKGTAIQMRFVKENADCPYRIVGFAALENKNGKIGINEGW